MVRNCFIVVIRLPMVVLFYLNNLDNTVSDGGVGNIHQGKAINWIWLCLSGEHEVQRCAFSYEQDHTHRGTRTLTLTREVQRSLMSACP